MKLLLDFKAYALELCDVAQGVVVARQRSKGEQTRGIWWRDLSQVDLRELFADWQDSARLMVAGHRRAVSSGLKSIVDGYSKALLVWRDHWTPPEPHQELIPWMGLFRPVGSTQWHLVNAYPEDAYWLRV